MGYRIESGFRFGENSNVDFSVVANFGGEVNPASTLRQQEMRIIQKRKEKTEEAGVHLCAPRKRC